MKSIVKIFLILTIFIFYGATINNTNNLTQKVDYGPMIEGYLKSKIIEPTIIFNNNNVRNKFDLLKHKISWRKLKNGIEITVNNQKFSTSDKVTLNTVWDSGVDSLNYANYVQQVKIYEDESLIGFVLINGNCTGLGCGVNYQIIYDLKSKRKTYFGGFNTGFEFELYNFNSDRRIDYLSKTFFGRNTEGIDTTEFVLYSQSDKGDFELFRTKNQNKYWFKHTYTEFQQDLENEKFEENWFEKINQNGM